jgi:hypothetical protein
MPIPEPYDFTVSDLACLDAGATILVGRTAGVGHLGRGMIGSDMIGCIAFARGGQWDYTPDSWIGEVGSACMRAILITAARRSIPAVLIPYDPAGWPRGVEAIAATFAYIAHVQRLHPGSVDDHADGWRLGVPYWRLDPSVFHCSVLPPDGWSSALPHVECTDEHRAFGQQRAAGLRRFIADPNATGVDTGIHARGANPGNVL